MVLICNEWQIYHEDTFNIITADAFQLNPFILADYPIFIDTIGMQWSFLYSNGFLIKYSIQ